MSPENIARLELLRSATLNKWIALSQDETSIVAIADTFREVAEQSDLAGVSDPLIMRTPQEWAPLSL